MEVRLKQAEQEGVGHACVGRWLEIEEDEQQDVCTQGEEEEEEEERIGSNSQGWRSLKIHKKQFYKKVKKK